MHKLNLTTAERFILGRRREKLSRKNFAKKHNMTVYRVSKIEKGYAKRSTIAVAVDPSIHETAFILRKRSKLKVNDLAKKLKVSKQTILNREGGRRDPNENIKFLKEYYEQTR